MSKTIIEVKCFDQVLTFTNTPVIASGGVGEDYVSFEFCEKWDGFTVTALFWRQGVDPIPVLADEDGLYQVPPELMTSDGVVYFGAAGVDPDGVRRTSEAISYRIQAGAISENTTLPDPDGDIFTQLLAQYADVKLYVASRVQEAADAAVSAGAAAEKASADAAVMANLLHPGFLTHSSVTGSVIYYSLNYKPGEKMVIAIANPPLSSADTSVIDVYYTDTDYWMTMHKQYLLDADDDAWDTSSECVFLVLHTDDTLADGYDGKAYVLNPDMTQAVRDAIASATTGMQTTVNSAVSAAGNAKTAADAAAAAAATAQTTAEGRAKQFWGEYTGDGTSDRIILFGLDAAPSIAVVMCKSASHSYATDYMVVFAHYGWDDIVPYGFQFNNLGSGASSFNLANGLSYNGGIKVNVGGVGGVEGFNEAGRSYYVWGLIDEG